MVALIGIAAGAAVIMFLLITSRGVSARAQPGAFETIAARTMRSFAVPRAERNRKNPIPDSPEVFAEGKAHWADHCATCHANDGSGDTEMGRGMYPKPPDMRLARTQDLSDAEIFYIIENGVRLTGMPAWGEGRPEAATGSWQLVHFVRRLPKLTAADLEEMSAMNPRSVQDVREELEAERSSAGQAGEGKAPAKPKPPHKHSHKE